MNNVPPSAMIVLDYIAGLETARKGDARYETVIAHLNEEGALPKPITSMSLDELLAEQLRWVRSLKQPSGAAGAYQIIRGTLQSLIKQFSLPLTAKFTPAAQDAMGYALLRRRGFDKFMAGTLSLKAFGNELAKEWASLPLLTPVKRGGKNPRTLARGMSYYAGDGINKSLDDAMAFETVLSEALNERDRRPAPAAEAPAAGFPARGARNNEVVGQVQRRLRELGYTEIGNIDGDFGKLTESTILLFRHDAGLDLQPAIDEALIVALAKAEPRKIPVARETATPEEVREKVPEARDTWWSKVLALWGTVSAGLIAFINFVVSNITEAKSAVKPISDLIGAVPIWGWALLIGAGLLTIWLKSRAGEANVVAAYQEGARR